jgi:uncharacterized membrane protein YsdA (DUF1294 family)
LIITAYFIGEFHHQLLLWYLCTSVITFLAYAFDKSKAQRGLWRIKERTLHLLSLIGGWPGARIGQQVFRHKCQKRMFNFIFLGTVVINLSILIWLYSSIGITYLELFLGSLTYDVKFIENLRSIG